ncbi:Tat pathway signal sequence domain protein (fragment) [Paraburkholderia piptadeniae]|uniref:Tat pathway signal sequence domain protein n=2 Tax=Paraburkholderia piptadeniae TaxID=1701573 RepID=A0A1N7SWA1_9BURK
MWNSVDGTLAVLDTTGTTFSTTLVGMVPVGQGALGIAVPPDSAHVYVANATDGTVSVIDATRSRRILFPVAANPQGVAIAPNAKHVYVAHGAPTSALHVVDPANPGTDQISIPALDGRVGDAG